MKHYHITWFDNIEDVYSKGETFMAYSPEGAVSQFQLKYPEAVFLSCISTEVLDLKRCVSNTPMNHSIG